VAAVVAGLWPGSPDVAVWRADAAGLATVVGVAAFARPRGADWAACLLLGPLLLGVAHAIERGARGGGVSGAASVALLASCVGLAGAGLASLGRRPGCPAAAAGAVGAGVLWLACAGVWWADDLASRVPPARRHAVREAVLAVDPFTAAAYGAADFDRLRWRAVYDATVVATSTVRVPRATDAALPWGACGAIATAFAFRGGRRRPAPAAP
jgi:hypothetical protein